MSCQHEQFQAYVDVARMPENEGGPIKRYMADVRIECAECKTPFRFIGLPAGCDLIGASTSINGEEARLAIAPRGEVRSAMDGAPLGFTVKVEQEERGGHYDGTCEILDEVPLTWLGGLLAHIVRRCVREPFFKDTKSLMAFVSKAAEEPS